MLTRWNPFMGLSRENGTVAPTLFDSFFADPFFGEPRQALQFTAPAADIVETESELAIKLDLPGHDPKQVKVTIEGDTLTVASERKAEKQQKGENYLRTERSYGAFARSFVLPETVDGSRCEAKFEHGVLSLTLPKKEEAKPKTITVDVKA